MPHLVIRIGLATLGVLAAALLAFYLRGGDRGRYTTEPTDSGLARTVSGNDLVSAADPALTLRFDPAFRYAGGQKFVLYGVADTEQYFFVEPGADNALQGVYWVQYEAYRPDNTYTYDYDDSPRRLTLDGIEFYTDTDIVKVDPDAKRRRGSDGALFRQFLAARGYTLPMEFAYARLVYLTDASQRKELMIIYVDDLGRYGVAAEALQEGGAAADRREAIEQAHLDRIRATLSVLPGELPSGRD